MGSHRIGHDWVTFTCFPSPRVLEEGFVPDSPLYLRVSTLIPICWTEGERKSTTHHLTHTPNSKHKPNSQQHLLRPYIPDGPLSRFIQTLSRSSLSSPQLPPHLLDLQPFALWPPHIWNLLLGSPTPPDSKSANNSPWAHLLICIEQTCPFSGLHPVSSSLSLLFTVCLLCLPPLSAFSLNIKASKSFWSWSLNMPHSLWAILSIFTDSTTTFSVKNTQVPSQVSPSNTRL